MDEFMRLRMSVENGVIGSEEHELAKLMFGEYVIRNPLTMLPIIGNDAFTWDDMQYWEEILNIYHDDEIFSDSYGVKYFNSSVNYGEKLLLATLKMCAELYVASGFQLLSFGANYTHYMNYPAFEDKSGNIIRVNLECDVTFTEKFDEYEKLHLREYEGHNSWLHENEVYV